MTSNELDKLKGVIDGQTKVQPAEQTKGQSKSQAKKSGKKEKINKERAKLSISGKGHVGVEAFDIINSKSAQEILKESAK